MCVVLQIYIVFTREAPNKAVKKKRKKRESWLYLEFSEKGGEFRLLYTLTLKPADDTFSGHPELSARMAQFVFKVYSHIFWKRNHYLGDISIKRVPTNMPYRCRLNKGFNV